MSNALDLFEQIQTIKRGLEVSGCAEDFLKTLIHSALPKPLAVGAFLCSVGKDARLKILGSYGYPEDWHGEGSESARLWEASAIGDTLLSGVVSVFRNRDEYLASYPHNTNANLPGDGFVAIPIWSGGHPAFGLGIALSVDPMDALGTKAEVVWQAVRIALELSLSVPSWHVANSVSSQTATLTVIRESQPDEGLTKRQSEVLRLMSAGLTNRQIAGRLHLSGSTIGKETLEIYKKLGTNNRKSAAEVALETGLISREEFPSHAPLGLAAAAG